MEINDIEIKDENILYISQFGSYGTELWIENTSDIDIGVIVNSIKDMDFYLEDSLREKFIDIYKYMNVNITIVELDLDNKLVRNVICGKTLYSKIDEKVLKRTSLDIEKMVHKQREYYEYNKLKKLKDEVSQLW